METAIERRKKKPRREKSWLEIEKKGGQRGVGGGTRSRLTFSLGLFIDSRFSSFRPLMTRSRQEGEREREREREREILQGAL